MNRTFLIVLDSAGIGEAPDADKFNDIGSNTIKNTIKATNVNLPNLNKLGLNNLIYHTNEKALAYHMRLSEISMAKDTLTGHLEMMGYITENPYQTFHKFDDELINKLEEKFGKKVVGNKRASGTEIIEELGLYHIMTGDLILYTSEDSVMQIAAHESIVPADELYKYCEIARELTKEGKYKLGRIIARPFIGLPGSFKRTPKRKDYALDPEGYTLLDLFKDSNKDVIALGKIADIFNNKGITRSSKTADNKDGIEQLLDIIENDNFNGICFLNLNDFDSLYGHRRNPEGYAECLLEFDNYLPTIIEKLRVGDTLMLTADHGTDPTYSGTDHTREEVPFIIYNKTFKTPTKLESQEGFDTIAHTIADIHLLDYNGNKKSIKKDLV
jgi:phosphopentomutase